MNAPHNFHKISAGVSLVILAIGFSAIGLLSIIHGPLSGDAVDLSATGCTIGGFAGLAAGSIFFCAAFVLLAPLRVDRSLAATHSSSSDAKP
jgi:hypothetical protein